MKESKCYVGQGPVSRGVSHGQYNLAHAVTRYAGDKGAPSEALDA